MKRFAFLLLIALLAAPVAAHAEKVGVVFAAANDADAVGDVDAAESVLRYLDVCRILPHATMKMKITDPQLNVDGANSLAQATEIAKAVNADWLFWLEGWNRKKTEYSAVMVTIATGAKRRAVGHTYEKDESLRGPLIKGVAATLVLGAASSPPIADLHKIRIVDGPKRRGEPIWFHQRNRDQMNGSCTLLVAVDPAGKPSQVEVIESSWKRMEMLSKEFYSNCKYSLTKRDDEPVAAYGIVNAWYRYQSGSPEADLETPPGADEFWARVFLQDVKAPAVAAESSHGDTIGAAEARKAIEKIHRLVIDVHPDPFYAISAADFEKLYDETLKKCDKPMSLSDLYFLASRLLAPLRDLHANVQAHYKDQYLPLGLVAGSDGIGVSNATDEFAEMRQSRLVAIEGISVEDLLKRLDAFTSSENRESLLGVAPAWLVQRSVLRELIGPQIQDAAHVKFATANGVGERLVPFRELRVFAAAPRKDEAWRLIPEINAGYFALRHCHYDRNFRGSVRSLFSQMEMNGTANLIIDLRGNPGGYTAIMNEFLDHLPPDTLRDYTMRFRLSKEAIDEGDYDDLKKFKFPPNSNLALADYQPWKKPGSARALKPFAGKVFVIVDHSTASAATWLATMIKDNKLGTIVGEKTPNMPSFYGAVLYFKICRGMRLSLPHMMLKRPAPESDPEDGLHPDVPISPKLQELFDGRDAQMEWVVKSLWSADKGALDDPTLRRLSTQTPTGAAPVVVSASPNRGDEKVPPGPATITVTYDRPMSPGHTVVASEAGALPESLESPRWVSPTVCEWRVKLEPGTAYAIWFNAVDDGDFQSEQRIRAKPYHLAFKTTGEAKKKPDNSGEDDGDD